MCKACGGPHLRWPFLRLGGSQGGIEGARLVAFDSTYLSDLETAIKALAKGKVKSVNLEGVSYTYNDLDRLEKHYEWVEERVNRTAGESKTEYVQFEDEGESV